MGSQLWCNPLYYQSLIAVNTLCLEASKALLLKIKQHSPVALADFLATQQNQKRVAKEALLTFLDQIGEVCEGVAKQITSPVRLLERVRAVASA